MRVPVGAAVGAGGRMSAPTPEPTDNVSEPGVTSGLVCGHHHLYSALARGMPAPPRTPHNFHEILEQVWWRLDWPSTSR